MSDIIDSEWGGDNELPLDDRDRRICELESEVKRLEAEANDEGPGTPMGRLNYICEFAEKELGLSPYSSRGADGALLEEFTRMKAEVTVFRKDRKLLFEIIRCYDGMMQHGSDLRNGTHAGFLKKAINAARAKERGGV